MHRTILILIVSTITLSACVSHSKVVPRHQGYRTLEFGLVMQKEEVTIGGTQTGIGAYIGSAAAIHDSYRDSYFEHVLKGIAGAIIGATAEELLTRRKGMLYSIETKNGALIEVVSTNLGIHPGACVEIGHAGRHHTEVEAAATKHCRSMTTTNARQGM